MPQYLAGQPLQRAVAAGRARRRSTTTRIGGSSVEARVSSAGGTGVLFYTRYFPGWRATVDGQEAALEPWGDQGLIRVKVPAGEHAVSLRYGDTPARTAGKALSLVTLVGVVGVWLWGRRPRRAVATPVRGGAGRPRTGAGTSRTGGHGREGRGCPAPSRRQRLEVRGGRALPRPSAA